LAVAALAILSAAPALAQDGQIAGTVRDASGAPVSGAAVTITNQQTGATRAVTSDASGAFAATGVPAGVYTVTAELKRFARSTQKDVRVAAGATANVDFTLEAAKREEEVTVTAMKREETVHNTPLSLVAPTEDMLRDRGVDNIEDLAANVGSFTVQNLGPGQSQVAIRGVSTGQIVRDQPGVKEQVGVYLDESVVSLSLFTPDMDMFDVGRVEVLRGPQGTLFGSGSLSGTVRYITNQPDIGVKKFFGELGGYTIQDGNQGGNVKLGVNAPLGGKAALRLAGYYNRLGGWIDSPGVTRSGGLVRPDPNSRAEDLNTGYRAGGRVAFKIAPNDRLAITPRFVYQKVKMDGWNRNDIYNILANPFTTTRTAVTLGEREQFAQLDEITTDEFALGDLTLNYSFGSAALTSITSYMYRDVLVIRDATSLTGSITGGSLGLPENVYSLDAPLYDASNVNVFTEELRFSGGKDKFRWVAGGFYSHTTRDYGQDLPVIGFEALTGIPTQGLRAPRDSLFWSELGYKLDQFALFGEGTWSVTDAFSVTAGLRYYNFSEDKEQIFDGIFGNDNNGVSLVSQPGTTDADGIAPRIILSYKVSGTTNLNAQASRGFRLGGINDPLNVPLCTPEDLATFSGRDSWGDETAWNYEVGSKSRIFGNRGAFNVSLFYIDVQDLQATVTAGSCSSRLIYNVPESRSAGVEMEFEVAPSRNFDFALSWSYNDSELRSSVEPTAVTGIVEGRRLPTVPEFQLAATATFQWEIGQQSMGYVTGTYQHVGDRYTQVNDEDLGVLNLLSFGANTPGRPLTQAILTYDPIVPSYDIVNLRVGVRRDKWDVAFYVNNLTDDLAYLAFDRERGTRARIWFHTHQPRTFGLSLRVTP
jgi:iron complex outermembrane receptor protein